MATATMATAVGAAMVLYYVLSRRLSTKDGEDDRSGDFSKLSRSGRRRIARRPAQAPATWFEAIITLSETLRFMYSENSIERKKKGKRFRVSNKLRSEYRLIDRCRRQRICRVREDFFSTELGVKMRRCERDNGECEITKNSLSSSKLTRHSQNITGWKKGYATLKTLKTVSFPVSLYHMRTRNDF